MLSGEPFVALCIVVVVVVVGIASENFVAEYCLVWEI